MEANQHPSSTIRLLDVLHEVQITELERRVSQPNDCHRAYIDTSVGVACLAEYFDDSFQAPADVERVLNVPVVLSLPSSPRFFSISS